ncbi:MAG: cardiolipin synthase B [Phycisphaerae bacterium]|nr:cardiolipin synthase B [Phycisphaerae bacterium]
MRDGPQETKPEETKRDDGDSADPRLEDPRLEPIEGQGQAGTSTGINTRPGSDDDGWIIPHPVQLDHHTSVQLLKDGEALHLAYQAIKAARHRVCLEAYIFANDQTGNAFADLLCEKAKAGVLVRVIYDSFGSNGWEQFHRRRPAMFEMMRQAGVKLRQFNPIRPWECRFSWRPLNRDHRKLLIIDSHLGGLGGINVGREWGGSWVRKKHSKRWTDLWRDNAIAVQGHAVHHLSNAFEASWNYCQHGGPIRRTAYIHGIREKAPFGLLASAPTVDSELRPLLCELLLEARQSIWLTMAYFAPDDDLIRELVRAARRGVNVRLMLPSRTDVKPLLIAARSYYDRLMAAGIEIYERQHAILHAKTMVIDRRITVIGSTNLDHRSIEFNCELSAVVRSEPFGKDMHDLFENDIRYARRIDPTEWTSRPVLDRLVQWTVSRARYLL